MESKAFAHPNINVSQKFKFDYKKVENIVGKGGNAVNHHFILFPFPTMLSKALFARIVKPRDCVVKRTPQPITRQQILDSPKLKEFADDNFKFDKNGGKLSKWVENTVEKGEIAHYKQFLLFPQCFQKT